MLLLNVIGCSVQHDQAQVENASLKSSPAWLRNDPGARGSLTAFNPVTSTLFPRGIPNAKNSAPILLDDNGEAPLSGLFQRTPISSGGGVGGGGAAAAKRLLPALYLEAADGKDAQLSYVADPGRRNALQTSFAPGALKLESYEIAYGTELKGTFFQPYDNDALHLLWIDEAGRVCAELPVGAGADAAAAVKPDGPEASARAFQFKMPAGTFGHKHKLALVRVPKKGGVTKVEAVETFRVVEALSWDDYVVASRDDSARRLIPAHAVQLEMGLQNGENPLLLANWDATAAAYAKTRDPKLLERQPALLNDAAMEKALAASAKNFSTKTTGLNLWSFGDGAELTHFAAPLDLDQSPEALEDYRVWLRERRYGSLKALNAAWRSEEKDWTKIMPTGTDAVKARGSKAYAAKIEVLKKGDPDKQLERRGEDPVFKLAAKDMRVPGGENFAPWADFRAYNDYAVASALHVFRARAVATDRAAVGGSLAQCGLSNIQAPSAWGGWSYDNLARSLDWAEEHDSVVAREILRGYSRQSAAPIHFLTQTSSLEPVEVHRLWDRWLRGDNGCLLAAQTPDAGAAPGEAPAVPPLEDIGEMARGLTLLRNQALAHSDPIAIYYSPRSVYLHWMLDSEEEGSAWTHRDARSGAARDSASLQMKAWLMLLEDLGYAPFFIDPETVCEGGLKFPATKIVILPKVLSLSVREAQALKNFAQAGGCVIADGACGTFDGAGRRRGPLGAEPRALGALDAEFGIARKDLKLNESDGRFKGDAGAARLYIKSAVGQSTGPDAPELRVLEPGIVTNGGTPHASTSNNARALFSNAARDKSAVGHGRYFYLNLCLMDYPRLRAEKTAPGFKFSGISEAAYAEKYGAPTGGEALRLVLADILEQFIAENPLTLHAENGTSLRGIKRAGFELDGGARIHALMPLADFESVAGKPVLLGAPLSASTNAYAGDGQAHFWYDMRSGEFLGHVLEAKIKLQPNRPALLAALPYGADRIVLQVRRINQSNVFKVSAALQVTGGQPGLHVFHFEVADTAGNIMPWHAANCIAEHGACVHEIAIGINAPAGAYHVKVRDVLSGKSAEHDLVKESVEFDGLNFDEKPKDK